MKKSIGIAVLILTLNSFQALAINFMEGVHYDVIDDRVIELAEHPVITEYFSFFCPGCRSLENILPEIKSGLPTGMTFKKVHVDFIPGVADELQQLLTGAYALSIIEGRDDHLVSTIFSHIHDKKLGIKSINDIISLLVESGIGQTIAANKLISEDVATVVNKMNTEQLNLSINGYLKTVPTLMVNNKYVILLSGLDRNDPLTQLNELIAYLNLKEGVQ